MKKKNENGKNGKIKKIKHPIFGRVEGKSKMVRQP